MKTVGLVSLGCSKNRVDSEEILGALVKKGFTVVADPAEADVIVVNTCGFVESAKTDSLDTVFDMVRYKAEGICSLLVVCGCLTERYYGELKEALPEADLIWGVRDHEGLAEAISMRTDHEDDKADMPKTPVCGGRVLTTPRHRAYLRIADGCDNRCTYCAIPLIRGGRVSVPMDRLICEAQSLAKNGVTELTVIAQDTTSYGMDIYGEPRICELLTELSKIDGIHWIRLLYTYPNTVNEKLIDTISNNDKLCNYIDMPIQHIEPDMLKKMNRHGAAEHIREITDYIRNVSPEFILRTTAIVGFPGETEEQFEELLSFFKEHPYDRVGAFTYSAEDGTPAAEMGGQIDERVKRARLDKLMQAQRSVSLAKNVARVGSVTEVLVDEIDVEKGIAYCRSYAEAAEVDGFITVDINNSDIKIGDYAMVRIVAAGIYDMKAELVCNVNCG